MDKVCCVFFALVYLGRSVVVVKCQCTYKPNVNFRTRIHVIVHTKKHPHTETYTLIHTANEKKNYFFDEQAEKTHNRIKQIEEKQFATHKHHWNRQSVGFHLIGVCFLLFFTSIECFFRLLSLHMSNKVERKIKFAENHEKRLKSDRCLKGVPNISDYTAQF